MTTFKKRKDLQFWHNHLTCWKRSGLTMSQYASENNLKLGRLSYYKVKKFGANPKFQNAKKTKSNGFIPLTFNDSNSITITVKGVSFLVPVARLKEVIDVLGVENE